MATLATTSASGAPAPRDSAWRRAVAAYVDSPFAVGALLVLVLILLASTMAPLVSPQNPYDLAQLNIIDARLPPATRSKLTGTLYLLGTDEQGRDLLSAILYGLRISLLVGVSATALALTIGSIVGLVAGYFGGRTEALIMRLADMQLSFPAILIALILIAVLGQGVGKVIAALVAVQWAYYARTARSAALVERRKEYVEAAVLMRLSTPRILLRHLLPNCTPPLIVVAALQIAAAISLEATLSFLGLGLPITEPSLGLLISNGFQYLMSGKYWMSFFPGVALVTTIVSINVVADQLRDVLNPRLQGV
jgi:peptide/nickel transport system permease protein